MWGPMMAYGFGGGWGWMMALNGLFWLVLVVALVALILRSSRSLGGERPSPRSPGLDALEERYARGEIQREEFLQKKTDILASGRAS
jgi:putative membrane protein